MRIWRSRPACPTPRRRDPRCTPQPAPQVAPAKFDATACASYSDGPVAPVRVASLVEGGVRLGMAGTLAADELDSELIAVSVDEGAHFVVGRSSSAAKSADADFKISFASRISASSRLPLPRARTPPSDPARTAASRGQPWQSTAPVKQLPELNSSTGYRNLTPSAVAITVPGSAALAQIGVIDPPRDANGRLLIDRAASVLGPMAVLSAHLHGLQIGPLRRNAAVAQGRRHDGVVAGSGPWGARDCTLPMACAAAQRPAGAG